MIKSKNKRLLAFDIGTKYIGYAFNNLNLSTSTRVLSYLTIKKNKINFKKLDEIILKWKPDVLIVGFPIYHKKMFINYYIKKIIKLISIRYNIYYFKQCENLTSWDAKYLYKKEKKIINAYAAMLILNNYLT